MLYQLLIFIERKIYGKGQNRYTKNRGYRKIPLSSFEKETHNFIKFNKKLRKLLILFYIDLLADAFQMYYICIVNRVF